MRQSSIFAFAPFALVSLASLAACSGRNLCGDFGSSAPANAGSSSSSSSSGASSSGGYSGSKNAVQPESSEVAARAVAEANIVQLDDEQDRIYAVSRSGTLAIVDAAQPGALHLMGKTALPGRPFEMYRRGDVLLTMSNGAVGVDGNVVAPLSEGATPAAQDDRTSAVIAAVDVHDPSNARTLGTFKVAGEIADSRIVGNVLYLATYENTSCWGCGTARTVVTSFDVSQPAAPKQVDQVTFSSPSTGFDAAWAMPWKRSIVATPTRLYVGGLSADAATTTNEGVIEVLDIGDPTGILRRGAKISTSGPVLSRWQMDEHEGVLRVVSQHGAARTPNGDTFPDVDTFRIESSSSLVRIGHMTMQLPQQEGLKSVRFDKTRAYAITFQVETQTDPLFTIDLADAANPKQKGELAMPGWVFHIEPRGDRLIGLGLDSTDPSGSLNVSLFDVEDLSKPSLIQRQSFGPSYVQDAWITSSVLAEDQDRIQKAFRIFDDGLIVVPFSSGYDGCTTEGGVQLLEWSRSSLVKRGLAPLAGNPRRVIRRDSDLMKEILAVSDSTVRAFSIDLRDAPRPLADVTIGTCVPRTLPAGSGSTGGRGGPRGPRGSDVYDRPSYGSCF